MFHTRIFNNTGNITAYKGHTRIVCRKTHDASWTGAHSTTQ